MKRSTKRFWIFLLLATALLLSWGLAVYAQTVPAVVFPIRPGDAAQRTVVLDVADSLVSVTATAYYSAGGRVLGASLQPSVSRIQQVVTISFAPAQTRALPALGYLEVKLSGTVRFTFRLIVGQGATSTSPRNLTLINAPVTIDLTRLDVTTALSSSLSALTSVVAGKAENTIVVATYADAVTLAVGTLPKRIRVTSESRTYEYWPDSPDPDKLEMQLSN